MDVRMPRVDGLAATRQILDQPDPPKVFILTTFHLDEYVFSALQVGASGFLLKDTPPRQIAAIRAVAAGSEMLSPAVTRRLIAEYVAPATTHNATESRRTLALLSDREREDVTYPHWTGPVERRSRPEPLHERSDYQDLRLPDAHQTRTGQPHPSRHPRPRGRPL